MGYIIFIVKIYKWYYFNKYNIGNVVIIWIKLIIKYLCVGGKKMMMYDVDDDEMINVIFGCEIK